MTNRYHSSLTSGDLLHEEILIILKNASDISEINTNELKNSDIPIKVKSEESLKRIMNEALRRIKSVPDKRLWEYFLKTNEANQRLILFYAVLMTYDLILDFMLDVIHEKWIKRQTQIDRNDFMEYVEQKSRTVPELEEKSKRSIRDMGFNVIKIMRQAGLIDNGVLRAVSLDDDLREAFYRMGEAWYIDVLPKK